MVLCEHIAYHILTAFKALSDLVSDLFVTLNSCVHVLLLACVSLDVTVCRL